MNKSTFKKQKHATHDSVKITFCVGKSTFFKIGFRVFVIKAKSTIFAAHHASKAISDFQNFS